VSGRCEDTGRKKLNWSQSSCLKACERGVGYAGSLTVSRQEDIGHWPVSAKEHAAQVA